ncbi:GlxA family transcriptional regulator [Porticoccus sp. W117]|uniref:GlxA family transcriptional regulator n=1 Tax=Porticoccus sp. W117 TaxID=3054777 RepID=UPI002593ECF1|nr:GlxA family transcriptional regulator [Porticoccus sp. W117]MDM3871386.1 GlxA family transcriptional regulator [Porticoccus sp. W117]
MAKTPKPAFVDTQEDPQRPLLSVGFLLLPHFTLSPFAAFIDTLRLAADEGDQSRQINCRWTLMGTSLSAIDSSCGVTVEPWENLRDPEQFDYIVVVGGLLHQGPVVSDAVVDYLQRAAHKHVTLVGLCTGSFALIRTGLMKGRRCCVSWFHYQDLVKHCSDVIPVADQLYIDDGDLITCAGGTAAADLAAALIERHIGRSWACKSLRILGMEQPRPANTPQPQPPAELKVENKHVRKALLIMEQNMSRPLCSDTIANRVSLSKRQLERLFLAETGESLQRTYRNVRLNYGLWLLRHSEHSVTNIAQECGFSDTAHFSRAFRNSFNQKPLDIRQGVGKET